MDQSISAGHADHVNGQSAYIPGPVQAVATQPVIPAKARARNRRKAAEEDDDPSKRRCVSTACIACRKRKSKCDGQLPACAACSQVYGTECIYDPNSDHRRKGVYKNDTHDLRTKDSTLHTLIHAILNYPEDEVPALVREIRTCESLDAVADRIVAKENGMVGDDEEEDQISQSLVVDTNRPATLESHFYSRMRDLRLDEGSIRYFGGTSNLIHLGQPTDVLPARTERASQQQENAVTSWTTVTKDRDLILHLLNMYFTWHYTYFTCLSKELFYRDFLRGCPPADARPTTYYCTPFLVNVILCLGCHFTAHQGAREIPEDSATAGDHFFREAKRLMMENDEHEHPHITNVQALALMSVREAGCGREVRGWTYSGMSFRMSCDMGLNLDITGLASPKDVSGDEIEQDARKMTFWGCYLFDKCWSNYMGRLPQLPTTIITTSKYDVFPNEDAAQWSPYTDSGFSPANAQPARTRAVALQILKLCEISNDLMQYFYNPIDIDKTKGKAAELKKLSEIHTRLESWRRELPAELEPIEGGLSSVLLMHMFSWLLIIHLFRPFLKYTQATSPLPSTVSPRKMCTQAAGMISKLMRLYKRSHGLRQICNIAVYMCHSACTIHMLNLPDKNAKRDITHGVKHLEEIAEGWLCARRTLSILSALARKWKISLPDDAAVVLARSEVKFGAYDGEMGSPASHRTSESPRQAVSTLHQPSWSATNRPAPLAHTAHNDHPPSVAPHETPPQEMLPPPLPTNHMPTSSEPRIINPRSAQPRRPSIAPSPARAASDDMFGGIEQLIRESQDWAFRDQQQLASGFDNWNTLDFSANQSNWTNTIAPRRSFSALTSNTSPAVPPLPRHQAPPPLLPRTPSSMTLSATTSPTVVGHGLGPSPSSSHDETAQRTGSGNAGSGAGGYSRGMDGALAPEMEGELETWLSGMDAMGAFGEGTGRFDEADWYQ